MGSALLPPPQLGLSHQGLPYPLSSHLPGHHNFFDPGSNTFKQWQGLATRYDKLALTYRGGAVLRAVSIWLAALGDTP